MTDTEHLRNLLVARSVKRGQFVLASGRTSSLYIDARLTTMSPEGMVLIGKVGLETLQRENWNVDAVGGLTLGADPVAYAISHCSAGGSKPLRAFTVRKEAKTHGTGKRIEGPFQPGDRVVVIEDVITTGKSALQAIEAIRAEGGEVVGVLAVVDRDEGGRDAIMKRGYPVIAIVNRQELASASSSYDAV